MRKIKKLTKDLVRGPTKVIGGHTQETFTHLDIIIYGDASIAQMYQL